MEPETETGAAGHVDRMNQNRYELLSVVAGNPTRVLTRQSREHFCKNIPRHADWTRDPGFRTVSRIYLPNKTHFEPASIPVADRVHASRAQKRDDLFSRRASPSFSR